MCTKWTKRCKPRRKALGSSYKRKDEEFAAQSETDLEMERMMASMKAMGMGANMYSKDDLGSMMDGYSGEGADEEEEGDAEQEGEAAPGLRAGFDDSAGDNYEL